MENPEFYQGGYYNSQFTPEKRLSDAKNVDHFIIDDLLDFPNDDGVVEPEGDNGGFETTITGGISTDSSTVVDGSCNSSFSGSAEPHLPGDIGSRNFSDGGQFSSELCVPCDDLAELEWLSNFVEESFSCEDLQKLQLISGMKARNNNEPSSEPHHQFQPEPNRAIATPMFGPDMAVPAKARSKRSRAAPCNWTSRLLAVAPTTTTTPSVSSSSESDIAGVTNSAGKNKVKATPKKKEASHEHGNLANAEGRKCLHCATDKTPQWRTGPMGPKTLCNACGVRYKSGRLVPEYRPAASPTFVLTKHSNSHRKVLELRRQKEMGRAQQQQQQFLHPNMMFDVSNGDDYLIHQHIGPDFRHLI